LVTADNAAEFREKVAATIVRDGVQAQVDAMRRGFAKVFHVSHLRAFTPDELRLLLAGASNARAWERDDVAASLVLRDYSTQAPQVGYFLDVLCELGPEDRRNFLRFCTGSPRLPVGGWTSMRPKMTVVKKDAAKPDAVLPSCSTCLVILKLPAYSSKSVMRERLLCAIREGQSFFSMD
jgi:E3 ubiquitin-protein ligase TRIP12